MTEEFLGFEDATSTTLVSDSKDKPKILLCNRCQGLDLTVDKFIIGAGPSAIASAIEKIVNSQRYQPTKARGNLSPKSGGSWISFSFVKDLRKQSHTCQLCDLIYRAITRYGKSFDDLTRCSLTWEIHGRESRTSGNGFTNRTRWIKLSWDESMRSPQEVYLMLVAPQDALRSKTDASGGSLREKHFLGRGLGDKKEKIALIKSWIHRCLKDHKLCRENHDTEKAFEDLVEQSYFGVIDVRDMQLKSLPRKENGSLEPYVALSYVWGQKVQDELPYMTNRRTVMMHIRHGGLQTHWSQLPRTIQDAILIVGKLGYRYLWIDSLCIVQDSKSSWQLNASAMHLVYGNAQFTICAADGEDSSVGLRAVKSMTNMVDGTSLTCDPEDLDDIDTQPMNAECAPGVRLMVTRPLEAVIEDSTWSKRAWTFQERILSRRCLIFAEGRVYWQCRAVGISQDIHTDGSSKELEPITSPLQTLQKLQRRPFQSYMSFVGMYTGRLLTKQRDALAAFRGISWLLERYMDTSFLFGLPASHFDLALLWGPTEASTLRRPAHRAQVGQQTCTVDKLGNCTCRAEEESFGSKEFPTWAWAGWMGGKIEYQSSMLEGCSDNVREWLVSHTWIKWHIRDEKGHLQPLWDVISGESADTNRYSQSKVESVWGGYPVKGTASDAVSPGHPSGNQAHETGEPENGERPSASTLSTGSSESNTGYERMTNEYYNRKRSRRTQAQQDSDSSPKFEREANETTDQPDPWHHANLQTDEYGRQIPDKIHEKGATLDAILPDSPFGVIRRTVARNKKSSETLRFMPILQFCTWLGELYVMAREPGPHGRPHDIYGNKTLGKGLRWCDIIDDKEDWCGSIALDESYIEKRQGYKCTFIAISEAKRFTAEECPRWTSYIPKKRDESEWDLYYVLLLERNEERGLWERAGLGKVFQAAIGDDVWAEIKLG